MTLHVVALVVSTSEIRFTAMLVLLMAEVRKYTGDAASEGTIFIPSFIKIHQLF
jgi:hypothetical protein